MKIIRSLLFGFNLRNVSLSLFLWGFNLFFSFILYFGFYMVFSISAGYSRIGENILKFGLFTTLFDIFENFNGSFSLMISMSFMIIVIYILYSIFISSGMFSIMIEEEPVTFYTLFSASVENFFKFLKLFIINIINFFIAISPSIFLTKFFWNILKSSTNETLFGLLFIIFLIIQSLFLIVSAAIYDFSRLIRLREGRNFFFSFREGIKFVFRNKKNIMIIYISYLIFLFLIYMLLRLAFGPMEEFFNLIFIFVVFQLFIWFRYFLKVVVIQGELNLFNLPVSEKGKI